MNLSFFGDNMDGESWEKLCDDCYRIRYQEDGYQKVPATTNGDAGIEGFTNDLVYQCYYPEGEYSDQLWYEKLRDKLTKDIGKFVNQEYAVKLKSLGVKNIKEWHLVIPSYRDKRIIEHAKIKSDVVIETKKTDSELYSYINDGFSIKIKVADDFKIEMTRLIRNSCLDVKLNMAIKDADIDLSKCESVKVENIKRKVKAVMGEISEQDKHYIELVNIYVEYYMRGIELLKIFSTDFPEVYGDINELLLAYKKKVYSRTLFNPDKSMNATIFNEILAEFGARLEQEFRYLSFASVTELQHDMIAGWLADCSMEFR
ncbi:hypothetical protein [Clostridium sp. KNHs205]|jgi:hypothetical protein|uniref:hypothetical protein n=1 Tax=Clostridium sp. KNHs205 TaxID=1449050 RepID=UPI00051B6FB7|nr:hypothetical protein [Clostridium sp. KNHs205]